MFFNCLLEMLYGTVIWAISCYCPLTDDYFCPSSCSFIQPKMMAKPVWCLIRVTRGLVLNVMQNPWHSWIFRRTAAVCIRLSRRKGAIRQAKYEMSYLRTRWYKRILNICQVIAEYEQPLIDAAYSVNVSIYGINPIAEFDQYMIDAAYSVIITTE